tara:strand:- start:968 stop:1993 length:1026 start_codon:yes stop_codon:yes gene_type:complete
MATTSFTYATSANFRDYFPHLVNTSDNKNPIYNWASTAVTNKYISHNTGYVNVLFLDGKELGSAESDASAVDANEKWFYDSTNDSITLFSTTDPNNLVVESGSDYTTYFNNLLYNASMELNNMLDSRFNTPIQKAFIHSDTPSSDTAQYDAIIIKITCYIVAVNILRASGDYEQAEILYNQITNTEETGMVDKLNNGVWKLSFETDSKDKSGDIIEITNTGSMELVETYGEWTGAKYDRIQLICTTAGGYGTAEMTIKVSDGDQLYGATSTQWKVTGGLDHVTNGLYVRFEGNAMAENDRWDIEVRNYSNKMNNSSGTRSITSVRSDLSPAKVRQHKLGTF